jgi:hypothetical protein
MADVAEPGQCRACGRSLPRQQGRGRKREYCDARCRDAARRERARQTQRETQNVNADLTGPVRHGNLDAVDGMPSGAGEAVAAGDAVAAGITAAARRLAAELSQPASPQAAVVAARDLAAAAEAALQASVDRARSAGLSWREIGDVLGTSRQAAFQRFGHPVDPRTGEPMTRAVPQATVQRAAAFVASFTEGRWDEVLAAFDEFMRNRHDADRLASGWAQMIGMYGSYEARGEIVPVAAGDDTVVDVLLHFEAGEAMLWARFGPDGKVSGLRLHPPGRLAR